MFSDLKNKVVLVTGASSGIGRQVCIDISVQGGIVIALGRDENRLKDTMDLLEGEGHRFLSFDLGETSKIRENVQLIDNVYAIVHCAGIAQYIPFKAISEKDIEKTQRINYEAPLLLTQQLLKYKKVEKKGSIIFISSISSLVGVTGNTLYAGSKAALVAASRALAIEVAGQSIRVNCISPGMVVTPMTDNIKNVISEEAFKDNEKLHLLGLGTPEDVSNVVLFLLSEKSRWITGTNLVVDGGYTCK